MLFPRSVAKQLRKPHGFFGKIIGRMLAKENAPINDWIISLLDVQPSDHVLEIGFGPGYAIKKIAAMLESGKVVGVDFSKTMLTEAQKLCKEEINNRLVELQLGTASSIPYDEGTFDTMFAINVLYFWDDPTIELQEIYRVLKTHGKAVIHFNSKESIQKFPPVQTDIFQIYSDDEVVQLMEEVGFRNVKCVRKQFKDVVGVCAIGERASLNRAHQS